MKCTSSEKSFTGSNSGSVAASGPSSHEHQAPLGDNPTRFVDPPSRGPIIWSNQIARNHAGARYRSFDWASSVRLTITCTSGGILYAWQVGCLARSRGTWADGSRGEGPRSPRLSLLPPLPVLECRWNAWTVRTITHSCVPTWSVEDGPVAAGALSILVPEARLREQTMAQTRLPPKGLTQRSRRQVRASLGVWQLGPSFSRGRPSLAGGPMAAVCGWSFSTCD